MPQAPTMVLPTRLPLVAGPDNRNNSTAKDAKLVNCYVEQNKDSRVDVFRRPGMSTWGIPPGASAAGQGVFYWNGYVYSVFAGIIYKGLASVATGLDSAGGVYSFSSHMGADPKMVLQNGNDGYAYEDTSLASANLHSISASYPQYTVKGLVYLNGAMYVMQHFFGTNITPAVIWGSVVNSVDQPTDWDPLDFITAQIEPDSGVYLAKQLIYVVALKEWTAEAFFDAGNATGSPLQAMQTSKIPYGCAHAGSVQSITDVLFWLSTNRSASFQVVALDKLQPRIISTPEIDRLLNQAGLTKVYSWQIKSGGHSFYVLTITDINLTLAYDIDQDRWSQWTDVNGNYVPIVASCRDATGNHILQHETNGTLYYASPNYLDDDGSLITCTLVTPPFDGNTMRNKQLGAMMLMADQSIGCLMTAQVSDDDYQTWSQPRTFDMSERYPILSDCGSFRVRAWKFIIANRIAFRLKAIELQMDLGSL